MDTVGTIYEILSGNLFSANINDANERLACAKIIADVIGRNPSMEAPRGGVLVYYRDGDGVRDIVIKTDPPLENRDVIQRAIEALIAIKP